MKRLKGCLLVVFVFAVIGLMGQAGNSSRNVLPTLAVLPSITPTVDVVAIQATEAAGVTIIPTIESRSGFVTITPAPGTVFPTATVTDTIEPTAEPSITMVPNATLSPVPLSKPPEVLISDAIRTYTTVTVLSVQIADGRDKGGERVGIVAYTTQTVDSNAFVSEIGKVLGSVAVTLNQYGIDIDSVSLVFGPSAQETVGIVSAQAVDLLAVARGEIDGAELFSRLSIETFGGNPAPAAAPKVAPVVQQGYPNNCDEAVAMGLTAAQAGQYSHLDRDGDGLACYGD